MRVNLYLATRFGAGTAFPAAKRTRGRPRVTETALSHWLTQAGLTRDEFAQRLGVTRQHLDKLCRGARRPGLDLAVLIETLTDGAVAPSAWASVPPHSSD